jgi:hypothetical protein
MAGTGTKLWATGDLVTASAFQTYLQDQVIAVFADSSARDAAFGGTGEPTLAEGMFCMLKDTNELQIYNGSAWVSLLDADTISVSSGNYTFSSDVTVGVDDTGHDVKFFGATAGAHMLWDESADRLDVENSELRIRQDSGSAILMVSTADDDAADEGMLFFRKSRGTHASPTVVQDNHHLGGIQFQGYDGDSYAPGAQILALVDGTVGDSDMPTELVFQVSPDGSQTPVTAVTIKPRGETRFTADNDITTFAPNTGVSGDNPNGIVTLYNTDGAVDDFTCLDFIGNGVDAAARIGMKYTGSGAELHFGTSNSYAKGITHTAFTVSPTGMVKIGEGSADFQVHGANGVESFRAVTSVVRSANIVNLTTSSAANVFINSANNSMYMSTSSARYKTDIEDLEDSYADKLLDLRPVWFRSLGPDDPDEYSYYGLIAEEVAEIEPRFVHYGPSPDCACPPEEDDPDHVEHHLEGCLIPAGVQYDRIVPHLINLLKRQDARIKALEAS